MELESVLLARFIENHPSDAARLVEAMPADRAAELLDTLAVETSAALLPRLAPTTAAAALEALDGARGAAQLSAAPRDAAAGILRAMRPARRSAALESMEPEALRALKPLLRYAQGCAGALMDSEVLSVASTLSAREALNRLRTSPQHALYYVYVVDEAQKLVGVINIRELMEARPDEPVGLAAVGAVESLPARASSESVVAHPAWKRFHALPVVETNGRFLGVIRYESVRELEARFVESSLDDRGAATAAALGELYGLGIRGLFEWGASALLGAHETDRSEP